MQIGYDRSFIYGEKTPPDVLAEYTEEFGRFYKAIMRNLKMELDESLKGPVVEYLEFHICWEDCDVGKWCRYTATAEGAVKGAKSYKTLISLIA